MGILAASPPSSQILHLLQVSMIAEMLQAIFPMVSPAILGRLVELFLRPVLYATGMEPSPSSVLLMRPLRMHPASIMGGPLRAVSTIRHKAVYPASMCATGMEPSPSTTSPTRPRRVLPASTMPVMLQAVSPIRHKGVRLVVLCETGMETSRPSTSPMHRLRIASASTIAEMLQAGSRIQARGVRLAASCASLRY